MKQRKVRAVKWTAAAVMLICVVQFVSAVADDTNQIAKKKGAVPANPAKLANTALPQTPVDSVSGPMNPEQFRQVMLTFSSVLDAVSVESTGLYDQIEALNPEELQALYDVYPNREVFAVVVDELAAMVFIGPDTPGPAQKNPPGVSASPPSPTPGFTDGSGGGPAVARGILGINPGDGPVLANYPMPGGLWFDLLGVLGLANDERCDPDFEAGLVTALEIAKAAAIVAQAACDSIVVILGEGTNAPFCVAAGIANGVAFAAEFILKQCQVDQARVDSAEIEATYENSLLIVEGLTCVEASQDRFGHGCNGEDDDCDRQIDECDEDTFGPVIKIDASVAKCCYKTVAEVEEAIAQAVFAFDDCGNVTIDPPVVNGTECDVEVTVTAHDDCGNESTASVTVTVDADGADITIDPSVNAPGVCYDTIDDAEQAVLDAATITDNCNAIEDLTITVHSSVTECALRVRIDVVDKCGNMSSEAVTVRVDPILPVAEIQRLLLGFRGEVLGFQTPPCYETVADAEAAVLAVTRFSDNCSGRENLTTSVSSAGDPCSLAVTSKAIDECLNEHTDTVTVRVDPVAPMVTCSVATSTLSPPNHEMINVGFTFTATDNCTGEPKIEIFVTSDERTAEADGAGQASPAPDAFILRDLDGNFQGILLRAERSSDGDGRVYEITVRATDECGNVGSCSANVTVSPANGMPATDSGQFYDATAVN